MELMAVRMLERSASRQPVLYEVHALWSTGEWKVQTFTSAIEAQKYRNGLIEGIEPLEGTAVVWAWNRNGDYEMPEM